jgi:hypothetical protein
LTVAMSSGLTNMIAFMAVLQSQGGVKKRATGGNTLKYILFSLNLWGQPIKAQVRPSSDSPFSANQNNADAILFTVLLEELCLETD